MKQLNKINPVMQKSAFLNNVHYEYVCVFFNGIIVQSNERKHFRDFFKSMFISSDSKNIVSNKARKLLQSSKETRNPVRPKRKWILIEQLQLL